MESLLTNLEKHVTCSICLNTFTEPKTIECLHTYCFECLKTHALKTQRQGKFRCPECQAQVGVPECFDKLPTGFLQNSLLDLLAVQKGGDGSEINCGNCRRRSAQTSFCFECGKFMCPDCVNAHELLRNVAFDGHRVRPIKHFQAEDYEALLKRQSFCSQQYHERELTRLFCVDCQACVCHICVVTDHKNHTVDPLDKAADGQKAKFMAAVESIQEKSKTCSGVIREFEQTALRLENNIAAAKRNVSQTTEQMIAAIREREREALTALDITRTSRLEKLNEAKSQVQSLLKQMSQAVEFASNLVQRSSSSDIMQSKATLENRLEDLKKKTHPVAAPPVSSFVKFVSTAKPENLTPGVIVTDETAIEGRIQDLQAGVEEEFVICPKLMSEARGGFQVEVLVEPNEQVGSLTTTGRDDGNWLVKFVPKVPGTYNMKVAVNGDSLHVSPFSIQVKERRLEVVGELDSKGETFENTTGIAVNSKGLIAVADYNGQCIMMFDKEGKYLRKFGSEGAGQLQSPMGVTYVDDDNILVADELNTRIYQFNVHTGKAVQVFGRHGSGDDEFGCPISVCTDDEGRLVVADFRNNRIQVFRKGGTPVFKFGDSGPEKLNAPSECIFHGNAFIICDSGNNCLKVFDRSGKFLHKIGGKGKGDRQLSYPSSLCLEKCGDCHNILVCDSNRVVQFSEEGSFTGKTVTEIRRPNGVATTPNGRILVTSVGEGKVYILK